MRTGFVEQPNGGDMQRLMLLIIALFALNTAANAADNGIYIGAAVGQAAVELDDVLANDDFDGDDLGYKIIVGIRPLDWLGLEAAYVNFGEPDDRVAGARLKADGDGFMGQAVGFWALGPIDLFAKAGVISWDTKVGNFKSDGTDLTYGAGIQFRLLSLAVRAEYEVFDVDDLDDANLFSLGVTYTFF